MWTPHGVPAEQRSPKQLQAGPGNLALKMTTEVIKIKANYRFAELLLTVVLVCVGKDNVANGIGILCFRDEECLS